MMDKVSTNNILCKLEVAGLNKKNKSFLFSNFYNYYEEREGIKKFFITSYKNSPHYVSLIKNDFQIYLDYVSRIDQPDHTISKFIKLVENFSENELTLNKILLKKITLKKKKFYLIVDGLHRTSIFFYRYSLNSLPEKYYEITNST